MIYMNSRNEPSYPYYYLDKKNQQEYLFIYPCVLENEPYFTEDFYDPYPVGTLLCKCLNIFSEIYELIKKSNAEDYNSDIDLPAIILKIIRNYLPTGKERNTSLDELNLFIEFGFFEGNINGFDFNSDTFSQLLNCLHYVELCTRNKQYSNLDCLVRFATLNYLRVKGSFKALNGVPEKTVDYTISPWEIKMYFDRQYEMNRYGEENCGINRRVYVDLIGLDTIADLILTSLNELFSLEKTVNKCEVCGKFFVPQRTDTKYCDGLFPGSDTRTCRQEGKLRKQLQRTRLSETERQYRSISQMMREKIEVLFGNQDNETAIMESKKLVDFQNMNKEMKSKYKRNEITEWEYSQWLKSFYKRKYKQVGSLRL